MKKVNAGLLAIIIAIGAFAFTKANQAKDAKYSVSLYWFLTSSQGSAPPFEPIEAAPYGCQDKTRKFCAAGWTGESRNSSGQYVPAGTHMLDVHLTQ